MDDKAVLKIVYPRNTTTEEQTKRQRSTQKTEIKKVAHNSKFILSTFFLLVKQ